MINNKTIQKIISYIIVVGFIVIVTYVLVYLQSKNKNISHQGKYAESIKDDVLYHVIKVFDGDTLMANVSGHEVTMRLLGIDTPEVVDPRKPTQCFGEEASLEAKKLLQNKDVYIEKEEDRENYDKYGRILAYINFPDGTSYNKYMIEHGFAREYTFNKEKYKYQKEFKNAQKMAKKEKVGLWGRCK